MTSETEEDNLKPYISRDDRLRQRTKLIPVPTFWRITARAEPIGDQPSPHLKWSVENQ